MKKCKLCGYDKKKHDVPGGLIIKDDFGDVIVYSVCKFKGGRK